jgi:hypothetical protein
MRCLYCDRGLGILGFRTAEPFCSFEHRKLYYRRADPPLAKLLNADPHMIDRPLALAPPHWIPAVAPRALCEPSQTLRDPAVSSTGPVVAPIRAVTEIEAPKGRPDPVEFSSVVYVVPPGDGELTAADLRERILKASDFTATIRITLAPAANRRGLARAYGPESQIPTATCPVSLSIRKEIESPFSTDFAEVKPDSISDSWVSPVTIGHLERSPAVRFPVSSEGPSELPRRDQFSPVATPQCDVVVEREIARRDPIPFPPLFLFTAGAGRAVAKSRLPYECQFACVAAPAKGIASCQYIINKKEVAPVKARRASVFRPLISAFRAKPRSTENTS